MSQPTALVIFSGGQDSTTCLFQAIADCGAGNVQTISFQYGQRHAIELQRAAWIAQDLGVPHTVLDLSLLGSITLWGTDSFCIAPICAELRGNPCHINDTADSTHAHDDTTFFKKTIKTYQISSKS